MANTVIRYNFDEFTKYKPINNIIIPELQKHCINNNNSNIQLRDEFTNELKIIVDALMKGVNLNNILLKNLIKEYLNKLTKTNYSTIIEQLNQINYNEDILITLATELIVRSMNDYVSSKGFEIENEHTFTDINTDIIVYFINKTNESDIKFKNILLKLCKYYFDDFMDPIKSLDKNNVYRVDNYKGFMNLLGLLFRKNVITQEIVVEYLTSINNLILNGTKTLEEVQNIFMGYERIINQLLFVDKNNKELFIKIKEIHLNIIADKTRFKKFGLVTHAKLLDKINSLLD